MRVLEVTGENSTLVGKSSNSLAGDLHNSPHSANFRGSR